MQPSLGIVCENKCIVNLSRPNNISLHIGHCSRRLDTLTKLVRSISTLAKFVWQQSGQGNCLVGVEHIFRRITNGLVFDDGFDGTINQWINPCTQLCTPITCDFPTQCRCDHQQHPTFVNCVEIFSYVCETELNARACWHVARKLDVYSRRYKYNLHGPRFSRFSSETRLLQAQYSLLCSSHGQESIEFEFILISREIIENYRN